MFKNLTNQFVVFTSTLNTGTIIKILVVLALILAVLAHTGTVMAEPVWGGSVG
jgi:hypothetical protein